MEILLKVRNQHIIRYDDSMIVAGCKNYLTVKFMFVSRDWQGEKTAIFTKNGNSYHVLLDENDSCVVPWEVIEAPSFRVSLFAGDLITADSVLIPVISSGYCEETSAPSNPTSTIYNQIIKKLSLLEVQSVDDDRLATVVNNHLDRRIPGAIISDATGSVISVNDSSETRLESITLYGKSIQDGTPSVDAPIDIKSVGDSGSIGVAVQGINLVNLHATPYNNTSSSLEISEDGYEITVSAKKAWGGVSYLLPNNVKGNTVYISIDECTIPSGAGIQFITKDRDGVPSYQMINASHINKTVSVKIPKDSTEVRLYFLCNNSSTELDEPLTINCKGLSISLIDTTEWTRYVDTQLVNISLEDTLKGIAVTSGGNYTDESGQQWISDTLQVFADGSGILTQRVKKYLLGTDVKISGVETNTILGSRAKFNLEAQLKKSDTTNGCTSMCTHVVLGKSGGTWDTTYCYTLGQSIGNSACYVSLLGAETKEDFDTFFAENDVIVYACLTTPIITELTEDQVAEFLALHSYKPNTIFTTNDFGDLGVSYVADTKTYIDKKFTELAYAIIASAE